MSLAVDGGRRVGRHAAAEHGHRGERRGVSGRTEHARRVARPAGGVPLPALNERERYGSNDTRTESAPVTAGSRSSPNAYRPAIERTTGERSMPTPRPTAPAYHSRPS